MVMVRLVVGVLPMVMIMVHNQLQERPWLCRFAFIVVVVEKLLKDHVCSRKFGSQAARIYLVRLV
jgi:hypothetical protein